MGVVSSKKLIARTGILVCFLCAVHCANHAHGSTRSINSIHTELEKAEIAVLESAQKKDKAVIQVRKMKKLLSLQKKEIQLAKLKVESLKDKINKTSESKKSLESRIANQKLRIHRDLALLYRSSDELTQEAGTLWVGEWETTNDKSIYLTRLLKKNAGQIQFLKTQSNELESISKREFSEKAELEYYVQELQEKSSLLGQPARMKILRESEAELRRVLLTKKSLHALNSSPVEMRGKISQPVEGPILSQFGRSYDPKTSLFTFQKGISIGSKAGSEVKVVAAGKVVYAGALKNYGLMVIVEHVGEVFTLYGQLGKTEVSEGIELKEGAVLGRSSDFGTPIYFEIRDRSIAMNPLQWLKKTTLSANR